MIELKIAILVALMGALLLGMRIGAAAAWTSSIQLMKGNLEGAVTTTILTMTVSLIWGAILTLVITLLARGLGV